jgi:hypothetical protein
MTRENGRLAWKPIVQEWFNSNIGGDFTDNNHVKNSFKKYYMSYKVPVLTRRPEEAPLVYKPGRALGEGQD